MKKSMYVLTLVIAILLIPAVAFAASPWTTETTGVKKAEQKLIFGIKNLLGGVSELFTKPMDYHKQGKNVGEGIWKGLANTVTYTIGGALHVATFPIPIDLPLPDNGVQL